MIIITLISMLFGRYYNCLKRRIIEIFKEYLRYLNRLYDIIHLLHAGEGNTKIYSPKSIIFPEGIARGEYDTRG